MEPQQDAITLGSYLRRLRESKTPDQVGLQAHGRRRVPGLRREELAALAGLSPTYYTRLEQSQPAHASVSVLLAISRVLGLNADEEAYLLKIGRAPDQTAPTRTPNTEAVAPETRMLVESHHSHAAAVLNYRCDILAWNHIFHNLVAPHIHFELPHNAATRPNIIEMNFLDPAVQNLYVDWISESNQNVAYLRSLTGDNRSDPKLTSLIDELKESSPTFAECWNRHNVENCTFGTKTLRHPRLGTIELMYQSADLRSGGLILKMYHAVPGSITESALRSLDAPQPARDEIAARRFRAG